MENFLEILSKSKLQLLSSCFREGISDHKQPEKEIEQDYVTTHSHLE